LENCDTNCITNSSKIYITISDDKMVEEWLDSKEYFSEPDFEMDHNEE
jgi:hypothetical protein